MPILHLPDVPVEVYESLRGRATTHQRTVEAEALDLLERALVAEAPELTQTELLAALRRHSFTPPQGTPDSVELLCKDRNR